jgi:hypothetical protein
MGSGHPVALYNARCGFAPEAVVDQHLCRRRRKAPGRGKVESTPVKSEPGIAGRKPEQVSDSIWLVWREVRRAGRRRRPCRRLWLHRASSAGRGKRWSSASRVSWAGAGSSSGRVTSGRGRIPALKLKGPRSRNRTRRTTDAMARTQTPMAAGSCGFDPRLRHQMAAALGRDVDARGRHSEVVRTLSGTRRSRLPADVYSHITHVVRREAAAALERALGS